MRTIMILSGGGSTGAWQAGALKAFAERGIRPDYVRGISVGAINGAMYQQDKFYELEHFWKTIKKRDVWSGPVWWNLLFKGGMYSAKKLLKLVKENITLDDRRRNFEAQYVSLTDGEMHSVGWETTRDGFLVRQGALDLHRGIVASTTIPVAVTPIQIESEFDTDWCVDGGVRDAAPIGWELMKARSDGVEIDHVYIILCYTERPKPKTMKKFGWGLKRLFNVITTSVSILYNDNVETDLAAFMAINRILQIDGYERSGKYRYIPVTVIRPDRGLGSGTDFDRVKLDRFYREGYEKACEVLDG